MPKDNLPLELLNKHRKALGLADSIVFSDENNLLIEHPTSIPSAIIFLPKSKELIDMTLALVSKIVVENGTIVLVGANNAGIGSANKLYEANIGPVEQKIIGNHSALYVGKNKRLGAGKKLEDFLSYSPLSYGNIQIEVANLSGIFSVGELDEGTKILLDHIPYNKKKILDIGCGSGVIGVIYKKTSPESEITMSDSSKLAVLATKRTLERNKIEAKVIESDVFDDIKDSFDLIVTNPPFHKGIETDYSFVEKFARGAKRHLAKSGEVYVVANSFLPYIEILEKNIGPTDIIIDTKRFRVYKSTSL
ncbi:MAG: class I SAM-dependent methyltransferase [bacterium]|nr:class I SAM-dependent methyltransferase [bacterium]